MGGYWSTQWDNSYKLRSCARKQPKKIYWCLRWQHGSLSSYKFTFLLSIYIYRQHRQRSENTFPSLTNEYMTKCILEKTRIQNKLKSTYDANIPALIIHMATQLPSELDKAFFLQMTSCLKQATSQCYSRLLFLTIPEAQTMHMKYFHHVCLYLVQSSKWKIITSTSSEYCAAK